MKLYKVFLIEVGVLLDKNDIEYESYSKVWDYKNGYYNEDYLFCVSYKEARDFIKYYLEKGL